MKKRKTYSLKPKDIKRRWFIVDARDKILGRLATTLAGVLRGKGKPIYTPHIDGGDFVIVINADKISVTGRKEREKLYFSHSGYPGGDKFTPLGEVRLKYPQRIIYHAVRGMLPQGRLGNQMIKKLKVYAGEEHPHKGVNPVKLEVSPD